MLKFPLTYYSKKYKIILNNSKQRRKKMKKNVKKYVIIAAIAIFVAIARTNYIYFCFRHFWRRHSETEQEIMVMQEIQKEIF